MDFIILAAVLITPATIVVFIGGILQPYVQEFIIKNRFSGRAALVVTAIVSFVIAGLAMYITGSFADVSLPKFALNDPSPLIAYITPYFTAVFTLSQLVFHGTEATPADPHAVADTGV